MELIYFYDASDSYVAINKKLNDFVGIDEIVERVAKREFVVAKGNSVAIDKIESLSPRANMVLPKVEATSEKPTKEIFAELRELIEASKKNIAELEEMCAAYEDGKIFEASDDSK